MTAVLIQQHLPRRRPGTHLIQPERPGRFVGRAPVPEGVSRWSSDSSTLLRLLDALRAV